MGRLGQPPLKQENLTYYWEGNVNFVNTGGITTYDMINSKYLGYAVSSVFKIFPSYRSSPPFNFVELQRPPMGGG